MDSTNNSSTNEGRSGLLSEIDWKQFHREILFQLDLKAEAESLGVVFTSDQPSDKSWLSCHAINREDSNASAAICIASTDGILGRYKDQGGEGLSLSFWDLAARLGPYSDWKAARDHFASKAGVELPNSDGNTREKVRRKKSTLEESFAKQLAIVGGPGDPQTLHSAILWAEAKSGIDVDVALAAGAHAGVWPKKAPKEKRQHVLAFFGFNPIDWGTPRAAILYRNDGQDFPEVEIDGNQVLGPRKTHLLKGSTDGLIVVGGRLALELAHTVWLTEGLPDAISLAAHIPPGHVAVTNACGAQSFKKSFAKAFKGKNVYIVPDADSPGITGAEKKAQTIACVAKEVKLVELPYEVAETHGKDLRDFFVEGRTFEELLELASGAGEFVQSESGPCLSPKEKPILTEGSSLKEIVLPGLTATINEVATTLGGLLAVSRTHFQKGNTVFRLGNDSAEEVFLEIVKPAELASDFEQVASINRARKVKEEISVDRDVCKETEAKLIMSARVFVDELPVLRVLSRCPLLVVHDGDLVEVTGYHPESGVYAQGACPEPVSLADAEQLINEVLSGFRFATPGDKSRALAAIIVPALVLGGLLPGRAPIDLGEADQSQTGKGFRNKLTAAIYRHKPIAVCQQRSGVGSLEEAFDRALIAGETFISIDNVRGRVDSQKVESFVTEESYFARCAYMPNTAIDPSRVYLMFTSNKAEMTTDLANRSSCVRILKQPDGYRFPSYLEGSILEHVRANQSRFLGAVFAIVREWFRQGKPRTDETRHDFREWAQILDWIVQNLLNAAPLMDGHRETQQRMANPALNWLRDVALAVVRRQQSGRWLIASDLLEAMDADGNIEIPGLKEGDDVADDAVRKKCLQQIGRRLRRCFGETERIELDGLVIERNSSVDSESRQRYSYQITQHEPADVPPDTRKKSPITPSTDAGEPLGEKEEISIPPDAPTDSPLMTPLINPREPADPAYVSGKDSTRGRACAEPNENRYGTISGSGGFSGEQPSEVEIVIE